jgi:pyrophosphatase PpaX
MFGPISNVVFDFDGTLVDTMPSVIKGLGGAIEKILGRKIPVDELLRSFGPAPQEVIRKWVPEEKVEEAFSHWVASERANGLDQCKPFIGAEALLAGLQEAQIGMGIFTGRDREGTLRIAEAQGWMGKFFVESDMVCGDDGYAAKPQPDALLALLKRKNWGAAATLMVGDHPYDMMAGKAAFTKTAAALWDLPVGQGTYRSRFKESWNRWDGVDCDLRLSSPLSLLEWFKTK